MGLKSFAYKHPWFKQLIDQLGHTAGGLLMLTPLLLPLPHLITFPLVAMLAGLYREIDQMRRSKDRGFWYWDRTWDVLGHAPGGLVIAAIEHLIR
jgi:hypothetical protein